MKKEREKIVQIVIQGDQLTALTNRGRILIRIQTKDQEGEISAKWNKLDLPNL